MSNDISDCTLARILSSDTVSCGFKATTSSITSKTSSLVLGMCCHLFVDACLSHIFSSRVHDVAQKTKNACATYFEGVKDIAAGCNPMGTVMFTSATSKVRRVRVDRLGLFYFFFTICALGLMRIAVDEHLTPPPSVPTSSAASNTFVVPSISPIPRFADLSLRLPAVNSLVSNNPATQQHPPRETPSPTPERVPAQGPGEWQTFLSVAFCCGELEAFE